MKGVILVENSFVHPYMPNSVPENKKAMLDELGINRVEDIYKSIIPDELLYKERLDIPEPIRSEYELKRHVMGILNRDITTEEYTSFLGAGCYKHQVPAICDEINSRGEFLTAYCGDTYSDHGKMQAIFEYTSMMGELLDTDVVSYTTYDGGQAVASSLCMAVRAVREKGMAGKVILENPTYLGNFETRGEEIAKLAHDAGAYCVVQTEVAALGIMESPVNQGADIVCGDIQPLGMHIQFGGGQAGFIACNQNMDLVEQFPTYMYGITETEKEDTYGWGRAMNYRSSHGSRENAKEYFGTETGLWAITAGVYLASMGPQGMYELGETIIQNAAYLEDILDEIPEVRAKRFENAKFQEFVIDFNRTGKTVEEINKELLKENIFGGKDLSHDFPELGQCALYCVSEITTLEEMEHLRDALKRIVKGE